MTGRAKVRAPRRAPQTHVPGQLGLFGSPGPSTTAAAALPHLLRLPGLRPVRRPRLRLRRLTGPPVQN